MIYFKKGVINIQQGQSGVFYVNLPSQSSPSGPTTGNEEEPFDLTNATEIIASFPGGVELKKSLSQVAVQGTPGCGKIAVTYQALDSSNMQVNPVATQNQDLQVVAVINGVAQVDTLSLSAGPVSGTIYSATINGNVLSYQAGSTDTSLSVFTALLNQFNGLASKPPVTLAVSGSGNSATLVITSVFAGLGFSDVVSNLTKTATTANGGTTAVFLFKFALNISPQSYPVA